jgi:hypothetical protein
MKLLKLFWKYWRAFGKKLGTIQAYIIYGLFYLIFMSIPGIISRLFFDPLHIKAAPEQKSNFQTWTGKKETLSDARMPF